MTAKIFIGRRQLLQGFGAIALTSSLPMPIPKTAQTVRVVCETTFQGRQWVVFDDLPTTIFAFDKTDIQHQHEFERGQEYLVEDRL